MNMLIFMASPFMEDQNELMMFALEFRFSFSLQCALAFPEVDYLRVV